MVLRLPAPKLLSTSLLISPSLDFKDQKLHPRGRGLLRVTPLAKERIRILGRAVSLSVPCPLSYK